MRIIRGSSISSSAFYKVCLRCFHYLRQTHFQTNPLVISEPLSKITNSPIFQQNAKKERGGNANSRDYIAQSCRCAGAEKHTFARFIYLIFKEDRLVRVEVLNRGGHKQGKCRFCPLGFWQEGLD